MKHVLGLYLNAQPECGGTYTYNRLILEAAQQTGCKVVVITESQHWVELASASNIPVTRVEVSSQWRALAKMWRTFHLPLKTLRQINQGHPLTKAMHQTQANVWIFPSQDAYSYLLPVPSFGVIHDLMHRFEAQFPEVGAASIQKARDYLYQAMCDYTEGVFVDSKIGQQQASACYGILPQKCHILPFALLSNQQPTLTQAQLYERYHIPQKYFFYPAQFWQHKNHVRLIEALARIQTECPDIALVLVGSAKNNDERIEQAIQANQCQDKIFRLGFVDDQVMASLYHHARGLVMPTFFGPTNIPPLEAQALGCPVIVSDIYGMREQLGDTALFVDPTSVGSIAEAMRKLWQQDGLYEHLVELGYQRNQTWDQSAFNRRFAEIITHYLMQTDHA